MRCCCCLVDNSSGAVTRTREFGRDTIGRRRGDGNSHDGALMVRARLTVGLGEGERMRAFLLLNLSKGRRYGVVGAAVRHGDKKSIVHEVKGGGGESEGGSDLNDFSEKDLFFRLI